MLRSSISQAVQPVYQGLVVFLLLPSDAQGCALLDKGCAGVAAARPRQHTLLSDPQADREQIGHPMQFGNTTKPCQSILYNHNAFAYIREDNVSMSATGKLVFWTVDK